MDAIIVGSGPNGLAAALVLARAGLKVRVLEAADSPGGGARTAELTLPGFRHDVCSAIHPTALGSPFLRTLPLDRYGLEWIQPPAPLAHPLDGGRAVLMERSPEATAKALGEDGPAYLGLMGRLAREWDRLDQEILGPLSLSPRYPLSLARFGLAALRSAQGLLTHTFRGQEARALLAGIAAHSVLPLDQSPSMGAGLVLGLLGHRVGWPLARGGTGQLTRALVEYLHDLGGEVVTSSPVTSLPRAPLVLLDLTPRQVLGLLGGQLPALYRWQLGRFRYGPGVFKLDYALAGPVPWLHPEVRRAATVHLGGTMEELASSERDAWEGRHSPRPYVLVAQPSLFDGTRAPQGKHTLWAYCHVPHGSDRDMTGPIEAQLERFAPGFGRLVLARSAWSCAQLEAYNHNYVGGDIGGGAMTLGQLFTRPVGRWNPYATPLPGVFLCSASTPPGAGVHGMCGYHAAQAALRVWSGKPPAGS